MAPILFAGNQMRELERVLLDFLERRAIPKGSPVLVGFSGGPDSAALAVASSRVAAEAGVAVSLVHVDHGIRTAVEREAELQFVEETARSLGLSLLRYAAAPGSIEKRAASAGIGVEAAAREFRYASFASAIGESGAACLLLAHTRDDQIETILMRALQGSGPSGLKGIPEATGPYLRPLLDTPRSEILGYLAEVGLGYRVDSTNLQTDYLRNRIRLSVLPVLLKAIPGSDSGLLSLGRRMGLVADFLAKAAQAALPWTDVDGAPSIDPSLFYASDPALRLESLYSLFDRFLEGERVPYRFLAPVLEAGPSPDGTDVRVLLKGYGRTLVERNGRIFFEPDVADADKNGYCVYVEAPGAYPVGKGRSVAIYWQLSGDEPIPGSLREGSFDFPFLVRSRQEGDSIATKEGFKPLKRLFTEWGVPRGERSLIPLIEDRAGIAAVLGAAFGYRDRFASRSSEVQSGGNARVLTISLKGEIGKP
jgi:tRNA(Ile)-lysidine synthetase-like protein